MLLFYFQLTREKKLLHAMMQHLHLKPQRDREEREARAAEKQAAAVGQHFVLFILPV